MIDDLTLTLADGTTRPAALALPDRSEPGRAVVVVHDITGSGRDLRRHLQNFADAGYVAIGPDLYDGGSFGCVVRTLLTILTGTEALPVIDAARQHLEAHPLVDPARIGISGFCMGGGFALLAAADQAFAVAGPFYGTAPRKAARLKGLCPTLGQFGAQDLAFKPHSKRLRKHLQVLDVPGEVVVHDGVGHSFMNQLEGFLGTLPKMPPMNAAYDAPTEAIAWQRLLSFFDEYLETTP
jgi:carboxymethylenebutenolidase